MSTSVATWSVLCFFFASSITSLLLFTLVICQAGSFSIFPIFDVVLAIVGVLPIVADTTMSLTMTTAPVFHRFDSSVSILLGVESVIENQLVFVGIYKWEVWC